MTSNPNHIHVGTGPANGGAKVLVVEVAGVITPNVVLDGGFA
jgi:hypothetical protein